MAKRRRELDFDGAATETAEYNTVFVDTSLDTHLAMLVSKSDTVSDFKKKMVSEHMQCFPKIEMHIQSLKVKRRAKFYHLPDSMHVWTAFHGVNGNWFLLVDASGTPSCHLNQNFTEIAISDCMKMDVRNVDNNWKSLSSDINRIQTLPMPLPYGVTKKNVVSEMIENPLVKTTDIQNSNFPEKDCMETKSPAKKKRKMRHTAHVCQNPSFDATAEALVVRNDQSVLGNKVAFEGTSIPAVVEKSNVGSTVNCQDHLGSDERKEKTVLESIIPDLMASKKEYELGQDVQAVHSGAVSIKVKNLSARSMDTSGAAGDVNSNETNRKKKKARETATNIQDTADVGQTLKGESIKPCTETHKSEEMEEGKHFSLNRDRVVEMPSSYIASDHANPDLTQKEAPEITSRSKMKMKKKRCAKKSAIDNLEQSAPVQTDNSISGRSGSLCPSIGHIPEEADKEESILYPKGDAGENVPGANGNEADFVTSTQTKQTLEAVPDGKRETDKETQNSAGNGRADSPVLEKENQILEFNQVEKDSENAVNTDKKAKKKRRKKILTTSDVQENLPIKDQKIGVGVSTTEENSMSFVNSETEGIHVASSQVLSRKSEEKLEEKHEIAVDTNDLARATEDDGEGINFKQYFVPGHYQEKVGSSGKVKKANQSNMEMKTLKKVKKNGLPSVSISTEVQSSLNLSAKQESTRAREDSGKRQGDSAQNSDWDEVLPNSSRRSSRVPKNGVKDSSTSEMPETNIHKSKEILAESSLPNKNNASLKKSSSKRSEKVPGKSGNKRSQSGLNLTKRMEMKTPQKKSLLTKPGAIFHDNSGESSGDENGTAHSSGSTRSPSDSSSMSSRTVGESELSQDSTKNGSSDAQGRSTGAKDTSKLELSAPPEDITMHMILRSSNRFKKAKLMALQNDDDQNESEAIEFVPDSLPI